MNPHYIPPLEALAAVAFKQEAQIKVLRKAIVELTVKISGADFAACDASLTEAMRLEHQRLLETAEDQDPALAALLDKRDPRQLPHD